MARVHSQALEITCLITPTPQEEFQLELVSQHLAYRAKQTCIQLACTNLEHIMKRVAGVQRENSSQRGEAQPAKLKSGSDAEVVGLVGAPQHNGRQGTVGTYDAKKQRYAVSLPACRAPDGRSLPAQMLAVKAANLLPMLSNAPTIEESHEITATLWAIESTGMILNWPEGSAVSLLCTRTKSSMPILTHRSMVVIMLLGWPLRLAPLGTRRRSPDLLDGERPHKHGRCACPEAPHTGRRGCGRYTDTDAARCGPDFGCCRCVYHAQRVKAVRA